MKHHLVLVTLFLVSALARADGPGVALQPGAVFTDCPDCPAMVVVPPGAFSMGFDGGEEGRYEGPVRAVRIEKAFAVGQFPVTNAEYARFVDSTGYAVGEGCNYWDFEQKALIKLEGSSWRDPGHDHPILDNEPVVCVSWHDSVAYAAWLSEQTGERYRLLSEAEWEYVARDGSTAQYPWGDDPAGACEWGNVADQALVATVDEEQFMGSSVNCNDGHARISPVDAYPPNGFGLYDLVGNSWEWTQDCYRVPYPPGPLDGSAFEVEGDCDRRAVRGGAWISKDFRQRPSWRGRDPEDKLTFIFGFRVARDLP